MLEKDLAVIRDSIGEIETLPGIEERWQLHLQAKASLRSAMAGGEGLLDTWPCGEGVYRAGRGTIKAELNRQFSYRQTVVTLDIGGGAGIEWTMLANHFSDYLDRLKLIVTGMAFNPADQSPRKVAQWVAKGKRYDVSSDLMRIFESNQRKVNFVTADIYELLTGEFDCFGSMLPFVGHMALVHENMALAHSYIPELEIPALASLLAPNGVILIGSGRANFCNRLRMTDENHEQIKDGFFVGLNNLSQLPWLRKTSCPKGYKVAYARI